MTMYRLICVECRDHQPEFDCFDENELYYCLEEFTCSCGCQDAEVENMDDTFAASGTQSRSYDVHSIL